MFRLYNPNPVANPANSLKAGRSEELGYLPVAINVPAFLGMTYIMNEV